MSTLDNLDDLDDLDTSPLTLDPRARIRVAMPRPSPRSVPDRSSGGERLFSDTAGRLWSAAFSSTRQDALVFSCLSDARAPTRAIVAPPRFRLSDTTDDDLRRLLTEAPEVGRLAE